MMFSLSSMAFAVRRRHQLLFCVVIAILAVTSADTCKPLQNAKSIDIVLHDTNYLDIRWCINETEHDTTCWQAEYVRMNKMKKCNMTAVDNGCYNCRLTRDDILIYHETSLTISSCQNTTGFTVPPTRERFTPYCYVRPNPVNILRAESLNSSAIKVTWLPHESGIANLIYRIKYNTERTRNEINITTEGRSESLELSEVIGDLEPNTAYNITIDCREADTIFGTWSEIVTSATVRTQPTASDPDEDESTNGTTRTTIIAVVITVIVVVTTVVIVFALYKKYTDCFRKVAIRVPHRQEEIDKYKGVGPKNNNESPYHRFTGLDRLVSGEPGDRDYQQSGRSGGSDIALVALPRNEPVNQSPSAVQSADSNQTSSRNSENSLHDQTGRHQVHSFTTSDLDYAVAVKESPSFSSNTFENEPSESAVTSRQQQPPEDVTADSEDGLLRRQEASNDYTRMKYGTAYRNEDVHQDLLQTDDSVSMTDDGYSDATMKFEPPFVIT